MSNNFSRVKVNCLNKIHRKVNHSKKKSYYPRRKQFIIFFKQQTIQLCIKRIAKQTKEISVGIPEKCNFRRQNGKLEERNFSQDIIDFVNAY